MLVTKICLGKVQFNHHYLSNLDSLHFLYVCSDFWLPFNKIVSLVYNYYLTVNFNWLIYFLCLLFLIASYIFSRIIYPEYTHQIEFKIHLLNVHLWKCFFFKKLVLFYSCSWIAWLDYEYFFLEHFEDPTFLFWLLLLMRSQT